MFIIICLLIMKMCYAHTCHMTYKLNQSVEEKCRFPSNVTNICGNFNFANIEPSVHLLIFFGRMCCQPVKLVKSGNRCGLQT